MKALLITTLAAADENFHGSRAARLREVLTRFGHGLDGHTLPTDELDRLLRFLESL